MTEAITQLSGSFSVSVGNNVLTTTKRHEVDSSLAADQ